VAFFADEWALWLKDGVWYLEVIDTLSKGVGRVDQHGFLRNFN